MAARSVKSYSIVNQSFLIPKVFVMNTWAKRRAHNCHWSILVFGCTQGAHLRDRSNSFSFTSSTHPSTLETCFHRTAKQISTDTTPWFGEIQIYLSKWSWGKSSISKFLNKYFLMFTHNFKSNCEGVWTFSSTVWQVWNLVNVPLRRIEKPFLWSIIQTLGPIDIYARKVLPYVLIEFGLNACQLNINFKM